ncbi:hypothetical protein F5051DRAFT_446883 [Lentinula edodes]|nr:hypothetical protein F5051DRAFT_446883 [Lentinula edodes]
MPLPQKLGDKRPPSPNTLKEWARLKKRFKSKGSDPENNIAPKPAYSGHYSVSTLLVAKDRLTVSDWDEVLSRKEGPETTNEFSDTEAAASVKVSRSCLAQSTTCTASLSKTKPNVMRDVVVPLKAISRPLEDPRADIRIPDSQMISAMTDNGNGMEMMVPAEVAVMKASGNEKLNRFSRERKSPGGWRSGEPALERPLASPPVVSPAPSSQLPRFSWSSKKSSRLVPVPPALPKTQKFKSLVSKGSRQRSAPSSTTSVTQSYSTFSYVPVVPHLIDSDTSVLRRLEHALAALSKPPPALKPTCPNSCTSFNRDDLSLEVPIGGSGREGKDRGSGNGLMTNRYPLALSQSMSTLPNTTAMELTALHLPLISPRPVGFRSSSSSSPSSSNDSQSRASPTLVPELTVLEGCKVFVDVWMSDGQDTSLLYIDIAKNLGAQVVRRIGPQCTHVVYTSGCERTVEQYLALDKRQRPKAVGASWLRDCKQATARLNEELYLVDMDEYRPDPTNQFFSVESNSNKPHKVCLLD